MKISPKAFVSGEKVKKSSFEGFLDTTRDLRLYLQDPVPFAVRHDFRRPECFITEDGDLGPYIRWALLAELLWERWKDDPLRPKTKVADSKATPSFVAWLHGQAEDYLQRLAHSRQRQPSSQSKGASKRRGLTAPAEGGALGQHTDNAKHFALYFAHRHSTRRRASAYQVEEAIFRTMLSKLKTLYPHRRSELLHSDVLRIPAMASHHPSSGPDRFKAWLRTGILPPDDDLSSLRAEYLVPDRKGLRRKQLSDVISQIQNGPPTHPFINIHAESAATGLTAMATSILVEVMQLRQKGSDTLPHGFIYVNLARRENGVEAPTRESVLKAFEKAFKISDRRGKRTVHRPIDLYADLLAVRQALTVHPTLVVVDGLVNDGSDLSPVFSLLRNTQWDEFLRILAMPVGIGSTLAEVHKSRSRFVILSSLRVASLSAWTDYCKRLEPLNDLDAIGSLFEQPGPFGEKLREQCAALGVETRDHSELVTRYQLKEPFSTYFGMGRKGLLPAECDLALASLLEGGDMALVQANHDLEKVKLGRRRQIVFAFWLTREVQRHPLAILALKMIATSINGLRLETLHRSLLCLNELIDRTKGDFGSALHIKGLKSYLSMMPSFQMETLAQLAARYPSILVIGPDETLEVLDVNDRWAEVKVNPSLHESTVASDRMHVDFVHEEIRALFVGAMTTATSSATSSCDGEWEHINLVFAEEALRQATAQLRHLHHRDLQNLYGHRRIVQTILHGLMSLRLDGPHDPAAVLPQRLPYFALPVEPRRRLQFLYVFLYRFCLEDAPQWLLARAFGRPDLKLSLLLMFADPSRLRDMLGHAVHSHTTSSDDNYTGLVAKAGDRIAPIWDQSPGTPALRKDVLRAIGRAAYEVGLFPLVKRVIEESQTTQPEEVETFRLAVDGAGDDPFDLGLARVAEALECLRFLHKPAASVEEVEVAFSKLHADMLQAQDQTPIARDLCVQQLSDLGFSHPDLQRLSQQAKPGSLRAWHVGDKSSLESVADDVARAWLLRSTPSKKRLAAADMLFRLGEILATEADKYKRDDQGFRAFLNAYAVYCIADRMRAGGSGVDDGLSWPLISSRPLRYFVRVTLKIAQFVALRPAPGENVRAEASAFLGAAKVRIDVHARHMHRLPRERVGMLLLMSSFTRVVWEVEQALSSTNDGKMLEMSLDYVHEAEQLAIEMGFPAPVAYRLLLERAKTYRRIAEANLSNAIPTLPVSRLCCDQAERDLNTLQSLSEGSNFWKSLVERLQESVAATRRATQRPGVFGR